jgi:hypothetical protein
MFVYFFSHFYCVKFAPIKRGRVDRPFHYFWHVEQRKESVVVWHGLVLKFLIFRQLFTILAWKSWPNSLQGKWFSGY